MKTINKKTKIKINLNWLIIYFFACISYKVKFSFRPLSIVVSTSRDSHITSFEGLPKSKSKIF
jgi:hypothetical protein